MQEKGEFHPLRHGNSMDKMEIASQPDWQLDSQLDSQLDLLSPKKCPVKICRTCRAHQTS